MSEKAPISDFNFGPDSQELTPFDVAALLQEYADGRRKFNQIDLKNGNLSDAHLPYIQLEESLLQKVDLRNAILAGASLNHVDLSAANLTRINLIAADLIRAKLAGVNLTGAFLSGANLSGANLRNSNLTDCTLAGANLSGVDFSGAILNNANMAGATLRGANLSAVDLSGLDLSELNLEGCILPADHGGASWAALRPGDATHGEDATTVPEPSQGIPQGDYPLDAFDGSYEELIQDLAETADWGEEFYHDDANLPTADAVPPSTPLGELSCAPGSPFQPMPANDSQETPSVQAADVDQSTSAADINPFYGNVEGNVETEDPEDSGVLSQDLSLIPLDEAETTILLPHSYGTEDQTKPNGAAEHPPPSHEWQALRQAHHQEEVIKTIQSALNRRTHYSLRRKLLEIYGKRCTVTDCNILPLLDTVLIDGSHSDVTDHPSNGLVLRKDIKVLYNLYLIAIHPRDYTVMLAPSLRRSSYGYLAGHKIHLPKQAIYRPDRQYLQAHLDQCKWLSYGADVDSDVEALVGAEKFAETRSPSGNGFITKAALAVGGLVVGSLLTSLLWTLMPTGSTTNPSGPVSTNTEAADDDQASAVPEVTVDPEDRVDLQLGPLIYPMGGVIYDESAYLSATHLQQAGLINDLNDTAAVIRTDGQRFVRASDISSLGGEIGWDAETRTVLVDCCENPEIEPINITVAGQEVAEEGLIIAGSSFAPVEVFVPLNIIPARVPDEYFIAVDQKFYVKANGLKTIGLDVSWDGETRTLNLER